MTAVALSFCPHTTYPIFLRKNLLLRKLRKIFFVSVSLSEFPPIPSPPHVNHTLSVLADSGVSSYSGINAEFSESLDGRKNLEKFFLRRKIPQKSARIVRLARVYPTEIFYSSFLNMFPPPFFFIFFLSFPTNISFHFSDTPESSGEVS